MVRLAFRWKYCVPQMGQFEGYFSIQVTEVCFAICHDNRTISANNDNNISHLLPWYRVGLVSGFSGPVQCTNLNQLDFMRANWTSICHYETSNIKHLILRPRHWQGRLLLSTQLDAKDKLGRLTRTNGADLTDNLEKPSQAAYRFQQSESNLCFGNNPWIQSDAKDNFTTLQGS